MIKKIRASLELAFGNKFQGQKANNCTINEAANGRKLRMNLQHFEAKMQITAKGKRLSLEKKEEEIQKTLRLKYKQLNKERG